MYVCMAWKHLLEKHVFGMWRLCTVLGPDAKGLTLSHAVHYVLGQPSARTHHSSSIESIALQWWTATVVILNQESLGNTMSTTVIQATTRNFRRHGVSNKTEPI